MNLAKVVFILGIVVSVVVGVGVVLPYAALALAILGVVLGFADDHDTVTLLVTALALSAVHGALSGVPAVGVHITGILAGVSTLINATAVAVIVKGILARLKA